MCRLFSFFITTNQITNIDGTTFESSSKINSRAFYYHSRIVYRLFVRSHFSLFMTRPVLLSVLPNLPRSLYCIFTRVSLCHTAFGFGDHARGIPIRKLKVDCWPFFFCDKSDSVYATLRPKLTETDQRRLRRNN